MPNPFVFIPPEFFLPEEEIRYRYRKLLDKERKRLWKIANGAIEKNITEWIKELRLDHARKAWNARRNDRFQRELDWIEGRRGTRFL